MTYPVRMAIAHAVRALSESVSIPSPATTSNAQRATRNGGSTLPGTSGVAESLLATLNPEQREAVLRTEGPLLILAGAGSGKTRVIASRIAYLIAGGLASPDRILAVTFTNKAAEEMRERVRGLVNIDTRPLWISTFHAICARMLRREGPAIGLPRNFVIYDGADQQAAIKQILRELNIDEKLLPPRLALARISHARNRMEPIVSTQADSAYQNEMLRKVYERYVAVLRDSNALDFDDLLLRTVELFDSAEHVRGRYADRFRYILVDEYQDTNRPQYLLVRQLASEHRNLAVVGDPDQSIYKWRGADLRNILDFERDFSETSVVRLERNYRSTQVILDAASAVIRQNHGRKEKRLWTEREGGGAIAFHRTTDELAEADVICRTVRRTLAEGDAGPIAVLYRLNAQSRALEDALMRDRVPYRIVGGVRFYERKEIKDALAYLKLLLNPHDDVSFRRVVNVPPRGIGRSVMDALQAIDPSAMSEERPPLVAGLDSATPAPRSLWARTVHVLKERRLPSRAATSLRAFHELIVTLGDTAPRETVAETLARVLEYSGYLQSLREDRSEESADRLRNLEELVSAAREFEMREPDASLGAFVDRLSLLSETDEEQGPRTSHVWLMTLHAAKGLEFRTVILAGMEEGLFPHSRSRETADLEEERRLCYVGMTRAQDRLILTSAARRRVFGEPQQTTVSRFVDEIPPHLVERFDTSAPVPPAFRVSGEDGWRSSRFDDRSRGMWSRRPPRGLGDAESQATPWRHEDEDQSGGAWRPGTRVRHPHFGVGTVVSIDGHADDAKLVVRFASVGSKKLVARFARLEPA
jgi:DNA helicase-2/ATP-dependent DNA helicase PcrA